jgi:3-phenylpropionate/trans-cinnamate dioxygenase ferredoxin reductase subunit
MRVEHRMNATEQGMAAARTLLGSSEVFSPVPYFWSDQYDVRIQAYGMTGSGAQFRLVEERPGGGFAGLYGVNGRVCGALAWNMPRAARTLRACVIDRVPWPDRSLSAFQRTTSD